MSVESGPSAVSSASMTVMAKVSGRRRITVAEGAGGPAYGVPARLSPAIRPAPAPPRPRRTAPLALDRKMPRHDHRPEKEPDETESLDPAEDADQGQEKRQADGAADEGGL